jgi:hypothetical protein
VLKSRLQSAPSGTYTGFFDCARKTIAFDGVGALWKGFGPAMLRVSNPMPLRSEATIDRVALDFFHERPSLPMPLLS